jgi:hypothetical protein
MANYFTVMEDFGRKPVEDINTADFFPLHNVWRNNPLSGRSIVKANVAGYYPYPHYTTKSPSIKEDEWKYTYSYVCSTIFPANPQFKDNKEIILYR